MNIDEILLVAIVCCAMVLWLVALVDVARRKFAEPNMKLVWLLVIVFAHALGAIVYLIVGRSQGALSSPQAAA
jgi:hypothetical protein